MKFDVSRIKLERVKKGWSQTDLAKRVHAHPSMISQIESGTTRGSPGMIKSIADELGILMEELIIIESNAAPAA